MGLKIPDVRSHKKFKRLATFLPAGALTLGLFFSAVVSAAPTQQTYYQGFETDTSGWFDSSNGWSGTVTRTASDPSGLMAAEGDYYAVMTESTGDGGDTGPFSRFDQYRDTWTGEYVANVDVYLDPSWSVGSGFDYSVASSGSDGNHQRDFIFHVAKDTSTGELLVGGSNNSNFNVREDLETINHYTVTSAGWYTLQHVFRDNAGVLAVDLNLVDADGNVLWTETRSTPLDTIPAEVGGNRYAWFTTIDVGGGIAVDAHELRTADVEAPDVAITNPADGTTVESTVDVRGTVTDDNPDHYYLVVRDADGQVVAGPGTVNDDQSFTDQSLFSWDTTEVADGNYTVFLAARDAAGNRDAESEASVEVTVNNTVDNKDECKNGGWAGFSAMDFKNQGQCVAAVVSSPNSRHNR